MQNESVIETKMKEVLGSMLDDYTQKVHGTIERETIDGITYIKRYPATERDRIEVQCGFRVCAIEPWDISRAVQQRSRR